MRRLQFSRTSLFLTITVVAFALGLYRYLNPPPANNLPAFIRFTTVFSYAFQHQYSTEIKAQEVARTPVWSKHSENPPLSAKEAMVRANQLRLRLIQDKKLADNVSDGQWEIVAAELTPAGAQEGHWFWLVRFEYVMSQTGPRNEFIVVVLMDGTVVEPAIQNYPTTGF